VDQPNGAVGVYSLADGKKIDEFKLRQPATIKSIDCTPDGKTIVVFTQQGNVLLKTSNAPAFQHIHNAGGQGDRRAVLSPDGSLVALSIGKGAIIVLETDKHRLHKMLSGAKEVADMIFAKDGRHIAAVSVDQILCGWDVDADLPLYTVPLDGRAKALALSPNGQYLAIAMENEDALQLWQIEGGKK